MRAFATSGGTMTNGKASNPFFKKSGEGDSFFSNENKSPSFFSDSPIQPKLHIGQSNDKYEKEADAAADTIVGNKGPSQPVSPVQMKCDQCDQEEKIDKKEEEQETEAVMTKPSFEGGEAASEMDEDASDVTDNAVQTKKENTSQKPNRPTASSLPTSQMSSPVISHQNLSNGGQQITQKVHFTQYIQKAPSTGSENENGQEEKEAPIYKNEIKTIEDDIDSSMDNSVSTSLNYVPTVKRGGVPLSGTQFGKTRSSASVTNVVVSPSIGTLFNSGVYTVTGDLELKIKWQVISGTGPRGQVNIQNQNDPDLKACNYQLAAKDLTPNMARQNGRPPRNNFWAEDLTIQHELFHAVNQRQIEYGPKRVTAIQDDLDKQKPTSAAEIISTLLPAAEREGQRVFNSLNRATREHEAYGDGAPLYLARSTAIKAKGDTGGYGQVAVTVTVHPKGGGTHTVVKGDTLWAIAESTYGHGKFWRDIHDANPGKARNGGNLILPGQIFDLPHVNFDKEVSVGLAFGANLVLTGGQLIPGGGSHTFNTLPNSLFDDTINCVGIIDVEVLDLDGNTLLSSIWGIPANKNSRSGDIEVDLEITSGAPAGP